MVASVEAPRIAILFGVPVDYSEFASRVGNGSDWLSKFNETGLDRDARQNSLVERWASEYSPFVAEPLQELHEAAAAMGVEVLTGATLETVKAVTQGSQIVILFAHWKGPELLAGDFIQPVRAVDFLSRTESDSTALGLWLRERLQNPAMARERSRTNHAKSNKWAFWGFTRRRNMNLREILTEAISESSNVDGAVVDNVDQILESVPTRLARRRDDLDRLFTGLLHPGNRLELFDGLHSKELVESAVSEDFEGTLDLTSCTSTFLADHISRTRKQGFRTVQFPTVQEFLWAAKCVSLTLRLVTEQRFPYQRARLIAVKMMERGVIETAKANESDRNERRYE